MNRRLVLVAAIAGGAVAACVVLAWRRRREDFAYEPPRTGDGDPVTEALEDSFPASDPPAQTVTTGSTV